MTAGRYASLISTNVREPLSAIAFHADAQGIERRVPRGLPVHIAIHTIAEASRPDSYIAPHKHDVPELNLLIGEPGALVYEITLGDETYQVSSPASIWIPAGLEHSANAREGAGHFVCVILAPTEAVYPPRQPDDAET